MIRYRSLSSRTCRVFGGDPNKFDFRDDGHTKLWYLPGLQLVEVSRCGEIIHIPWHDVQNPVPFDSAVPSQARDPKAAMAAMPTIDSKMKGGKR